MRPLRRLYQGQRLTEENFNEMVSMLTGDTLLSMSLLMDYSWFGSDDYDGIAVTVTRDSNGYIVGMTVQITEWTNMLPYTPYNDYTNIFHNEEVVDPNTSSDFAIYRKSDGTLIDSSDYDMQLTGDVQLLNNSTNETTILVDGLEYTKKINYSITRYTDGTIMEITSNRGAV